MSKTVDHCAFGHGPEGKIVDAVVGGTWMPKKGDNIIFGEANELGGIEDPVTAPVAASVDAFWMPCEGPERSSCSPFASVRARSAAKSEQVVSPSPPGSSPGGLLCHRHLPCLGREPAGLLPDDPGCVKTNHHEDRSTKHQDRLVRPTRAATQREHGLCPSLGRSGKFNRHTVGNDGPAG